MLINVFGLMAALAFAPVQDLAPVVEAPSAADVVLSPIPEVTDDELVLGEADAPVTIVQYTSMDCLGCAAWHSDVLPEVIGRQIASGRARYVMRQFPTNPVQVSSIAAGIIRCSVKERQMNVAGALFQNLPALRSDEMWDLDWYLTGIAVSGRTREEIEACLTDPATLTSVRAVTQGALAAGVASVPAFFVNGTLMSDGSAESLNTAVEAALVTE